MVGHLSRSQRLVFYRCRSPQSRCKMHRVVHKAAPSLWHGNFSLTFSEHRKRSAAKASSPWYCLRPTFCCNMSVLVSDVSWHPSCLQVSVCKCERTVEMGSNDTDEKVTAIFRCYLVQNTPFVRLIEACRACSCK